jgi:hypoxanthine phosphoribosyltransferase
VTASRPGDVLLSAEAIATRVQEMAREIARDHPEGVHLIGVLNGAVVFLSDLMRHIDGVVTLDFIGVSSYGENTLSSATPGITMDLQSSIDGRAVVIVEDIVDGGLTLALLQEHLRARRPRSLRTACLLSKPARRQTAVTVDYVGFTVEDHFVVGYGLDHAGRYRNLPYIAILVTP